MKEKLSADYWQNRYLQQTTGWNAGSCTRPIATYIDQLEDLDLKILIPGCGHGHEAQYLYQKGFRNIHLCDWAQEPLSQLQEKLSDLPPSHFHQGDFFALQEDNFDLIIEQTFFCALPPKLRPQYAQKMASLLAPTGQLIGLLFNFPLSQEGPPFGGSLASYQQLFEAYFSSVQINDCHNSIKPRAGKEYFVQLRP